MTAAQKIAKHPLRNDKLKRLAKKYHVPSDWEGDEGLRGDRCPRPRKKT